MKYTAISFPAIGLEINPPRVFELGPVTIHIYGLIIAIGLLLASQYCMKRSKQFGMNEDLVLDEVVVRGMLELLPLTHIRGRSLHDSWVIVDEAQSLEKNVLLTVMSRMGQNSKIVLTHDVAQRDNLRVGRHDGIAPGVRLQSGKINQQFSQCHNVHIRSLRFFLPSYPTAPGEVNHHFRQTARQGNWDLAGCRPQWKI